MIQVGQKVSFINCQSADMGLTGKVDRRAKENSDEWWYVKLDKPVGPTPDMPAFMQSYPTFEEVLEWHENIVPQ